MDAQTPDPAEPPAAKQDTGPAVLNSADLFKHGREVLVQHGAEHYRLRLTNSNKLILVK